MGGEHSMAKKKVKEYTNDMIAKAIKKIPHEADGKRITFKEIFAKIDELKIK